jgi:hypothetical protein
MIRLIGRKKNLNKRGNKTQSHKSSKHGFSPCNHVVSPKDTERNTVSFCSLNIRGHSYILFVRSVNGRTEMHREASPSVLLLPGYFSALSMPSATRKPFYKRVSWTFPKLLLSALPDINIILNKRYSSFQTPGYRPHEEPPLFNFRFLKSFLENMTVLENSCRPVSSIMFDRSNLLHLRKIVFRSVNQIMVGRMEMIRAASPSTFLFITVSL